MDTNPLKLVGAPGSPYSRKLRSVLRYRRIPYVWITRASREDVERPEPPVDLIPVLVFGGEDAMIDTTPIIRRLETMYAARSVVPPDAGLAFIDALLEDFADEWLTKAMFHYRWFYKDDIEKAASVLPRWSRTDAPEEDMIVRAEFIRERQIGRMPIVGCTPQTAPVIEASYKAVLRALDALLSEARFVMGGRPGTVDFGIFGQMSQLALFDPTPAQISVEVSPRLYAWCEGAEDWSGIEPGAWLARDEAQARLKPLLSLVGAYYAPFLIANAEALAAGDETMRCEIDGVSFAQRAFPYQAKCLRALRDAYTALDADAKSFVDNTLKDTGCMILFGARGALGKDEKGCRPSLCARRYL